MIVKYGENMQTTMTIKLLEKDKKRFDTLRKDTDRKQGEFLVELMNVYEKKTFNGIRVNRNDSISILLKSRINLLNLNQDIHPKKYTFFGNIIFESDEIMVKVNSKDICKSIADDILDCIYKWSVLYDKNKCVYLIYEEFARPNLDIRRCKVAANIKEVIPLIESIASVNDMEYFKYESSDDISFDELFEYIN